MKRLTKVAICSCLIGVFLYIPSSNAQSQVNLNQKTCYGSGNYGFQSWTDYYTYWYETYPHYARVMFPFGTRFCDTNATTSQKSTGFNINVQHVFPYYGMEYITLWVTASGTVIFNNTNNFETPPAYFSGRSWPNPDYPVGGATDLPFLAAFLSQADPRYEESYEPSQISYRILNTSTNVPTNQQSIMEGMLNYVSQEVRAAVPGTTWFHATYGVVVTWYMLTFEGASCQNSNTPNVMDQCPRNTYQAAIVTDGIKTYTVLNYYNITWVGAFTATQGCDPATGLSSSAQPNCQPAIIGLNAGAARGFTSLPYSNSSQTQDLAQLSGTNVTGRFIYDITGDIIRRGGCTNDTSLSYGSWPLETWPTYGPMLGGIVVNVSGPCFLNRDRLKCKFDDTVVDGYYRGNMMQMICIMPKLNTIGLINVSASIDGGQNFYFSNKFLVVADDRVESQLNVSATPSGDWITTNQIALTWNTRNLTFRDNDRVTIVLYGYQETGAFGYQMANNWQRIYTYEFEYSNTGTYTFIPSQRPCTSQQAAALCATYTMGAFAVALSTSSPWNPQQWWSEVVPLGWFANEALRHVHGHSWAAALCKSWYNQDSLSSSWRNYVPACPCTIQQAYVDWGRFFPEEECNLNNYQQAGKCVRHQGALACYTSVNVTSAGAGMTCCYESQHGYLMYSGDSQYGSQAARAHPWGKPPYGTPPYVPTLSHWFQDIMPWYYCCGWQIGGGSEWAEYDCFNRYMPMRPTGDCANYNPPGFAMSFGDPHFRTFDGTNYTFNSWGEFWLLQIANAPVTGGKATFSLQGRYQQPKNQTWGQIKATIMTAAAMKLNDGPTVSVRLNEAYSQQELLLIYVDNQVLNFSLPGQRWHSYTDFYIVNNDPIGDVTYKNFTIVYRIGIGVQVAYSNGLMQLMCTLPPTFKAQTNGLFGHWNDDYQEDLVPRQTGGNTGSSIAVTPGNNNLQTIHYSFGLTWVVLESESLFVYLYRSELNYKWYHQTWFIPSFKAKFPANNSGITQDQVNSVCFSNFPCEYDYMVAENISWAKDTYSIQQWDTQMRFLGRYIPSCGWLNTPNALKQEPVCYTAGCAATITGCRPKYWMKRNDIKIYTCMQQGTCSSVSSSTGGCSAYWSPTLVTECEWQPLPPGQLAAVIIPILLVVLAIIIAIIVCVMVKRKRAAKDKAQLASSRQMEWDFEKFLSGQGPHPGTQMQKERENKEKYAYVKKGPDPHQPKRPALGAALNINTSAVSTESKKSDNADDFKSTVTDSLDGSVLKLTVDARNNELNKVNIGAAGPPVSAYYRRNSPPSPVPFSSYAGNGGDYIQPVPSNAQTAQQSIPVFSSSSSEALPGYTQHPSTVTRARSRPSKKRTKTRVPNNRPSDIDTSEDIVVPTHGHAANERPARRDPSIKQQKKKKKKKREATGEQLPALPTSAEPTQPALRITGADYYARTYGKRYGVKYYRPEDSDV